MTARVREPAICMPYARSALQYDRLLAQPMLPWLVWSFLRLARRYRIRFRTAADIGCGTGRFVGFLAALGARVFGVDRAPSMLCVARRVNRHNTSRFLLQDMRRLRLPRAVDLITCNFDSLNYLLRLRDVERALGQFRANLRDGGYLIFDMIVDEGRRTPPRHGHFEVRTPHGHTSWYIREEPARRLRRVWLVHRRVDACGELRRECELHVQRAYPVAAILAAVRHAGLTLVSVDDARRTRLGGGEARVVVIARRVGRGRRRWCDAAWGLEH